MTAPSQPSNFTVGRRLYKVNDFNHYPMPVVPKPALGIPFTDPVFGATITRLTDISQSPKVADMYRAYTGYPKHNIENADRSKLLLHAYPVETQWDVYPNICPIDVIHPIVYVPYAFDIGAPIDFRWDNADPYVYYFQYGCKMWQGNIQTGEVKTLYDFTAFMKEQFPTATYVDISMKEEGDASGGLLAVMGFMLLPLSWWNDAFVKLPLALAFAWLVSSPRGPLWHEMVFDVVLVVGYWLTNLLGFVLMHKGARKLLASSDQPGERRELIKDL